MKKDSGKSKRAATAKRKADSPAMSGSARSSNKPIRKNGVLIPANNSFEAINRFVNCVPSPEYEELQWALLGIADKIERLDEAVKWALGENGEFAPNPLPKTRPYYWRTELRKRAYEVPNEKS